jgi:hypothetical protein
VGGWQVELGEPPRQAGGVAGKDESHVVVAGVDLGGGEEIEQCPDAGVGCLPGAGDHLGLAQQGDDLGGEGGAGGLDLGEVGDDAGPGHVERPRRPDRTPRQRAGRACGSRTSSPVTRRGGAARPSAAAMGGFARDVVGTDERGSVA